MQNEIRGVSHVKLPSEGYRDVGLLGHDPVIPLTCSENSLVLFMRFFGFVTRPQYHPGRNHYKIVPRNKSFGNQLLRSFPSSMNSGFVIVKNELHLKVFFENSFMY